MRLQFSPLMIVTALSMTVLFLGNGCRLGMTNGESAWKRPELSRLAFWKKEESSIPKPPAVHFDPTPAKPESQLASQDAANRNTSTDLQNSLDKLAQYDTTPKESPVDELANMAANLNSPIRAPYQITEAVPKSSTNPLEQSPLAGAAPRLTNEADFLASPGQSTPRNNKALPTENPSAELARSKFLADMQGLPSSNASTGAELNAGSQKNENQFQSVTGFASGYTSNPAMEEQRRLEADVAKAQREIAELKSQLAAKNQNMLIPIGSTNNSMPTNQFNSAPSPDSGNGTSSQPLANAPQLNGSSFQPSSTGSSFAPLRPNAPLDLAQGNDTNKYPSTTHGSFAPSGTNELRLAQGIVDSTVRPVGLQAPLRQPTKESIENENADAGVADIEIPDSILKGKGTYAPGSVNRLRGQ